MSLLTKSYGSQKRPNNFSISRPFFEIYGSIFFKIFPIYTVIKINPCHGFGLGSRILVSEKQYGMWFF